MKNIHILPTDKPTRLFTSDSVLILAGYPATTFKTGKNIYITSDEEITEGDWFLGLQNQISKATSKDIYGGYELKIILTTDNNLIKDDVQSIDDEFLEWFVNNPSCEKVKTYYIPNEHRYEIIIPKEEAKQETPASSQTERMYSEEEVSEMITMARKICSILVTKTY